MGDETTNPGFVCSVGPGETPRDVFLQFGGPCCGLNFNVILTPMQAASLSRDLLAAAEAAEKGETFESEK